MKETGAHIRSRLGLFSIIAIAMLFFFISAHSKEGKKIRGGLRVGNINRSYELYVPGSYAATSHLPLVVVLHGASSTGSFMGLYTGFSELAEKNDFLVLYPDAFGEYWNDGRVDMESPAFKLGIDDVAFISLLIDRTVREYHLDPARVYVAGFSNGGMMAFLLGIAISKKLAAVASVSGSLPRYLTLIKPSAPLPVLFIHGTDDQAVPWTGGMLMRGNKKRGAVLSVLDTIKYWARVDGCKGPVGVQALSDTDPDDGTLVFQVSYNCGGRDMEVRLLEIQGGGHTWPSTRLNLPEGKPGKTSRDIDATETIWEFFSSHTRK